MRLFTYRHTGRTQTTHRQSEKNHGPFNSIFTIDSLQAILPILTKEASFISGTLYLPLCCSILCLCQNPQDPFRYLIVVKICFQPPIHAQYPMSQSFQIHTAHQICQSEMPMQPPQIYMQQTIHILIIPNPAELKMQAQKTQKCVIQPAAPLQKQSKKPHPISSRLMNHLYQHSSSPACLVTKRPP